jgi:hypothetical protein
MWPNEFEGVAIGSMVYLDCVSSVAGIVPQAKWNGKRE